MNCKGFTLIEMMVSMAIFSIVMSGIIAAFHEQLKLHSRQQKVSEMQQNARTAMHFMARELRMAGFDPTGMAGTGIRPVPNRHDAVTVSMDVTGGESDGIDNDGDGVADNRQEEACGDGTTDGANEIITYALKDGKLTRASAGGSPQTLAVNIDALDFEYFGLNSQDPLCQNNCHLSIAGATANPDDIRIVQVSIISRSGIGSPAGRFHETDDTIYRNQVGKIILNKQTRPDRIRRLMLSTEIRLRNQGLR